VQHSNKELQRITFLKCTERFITSSSTQCTDKLDRKFRTSSLATSNQ
jgi:hypothetical protein